MINITLFGCGAIGSQLALHLASEDIRFVLVDDDEVAEDNIATSAFRRDQIKVNKASALASLLWHKSKCFGDYHDSTLSDRNYPVLVRYSNLALDCLDNVEARRVTCLHLVPTLHVGVSREGTGAITWDDAYVPFSGAPRGQDGFCTHLAGKSIIRLTACLAAHVVEDYLVLRRKESLVVTNRLTILR